MVDFIIKAGLIIIAAHFFSHILGVWMDLFTPIDDEYEYCHNCKFGFCTEIPKSSKCDKWRLENGSKNK